MEGELLPAIDIDAKEFWNGLESLVDDLTPVNRDLLRTRDDLQRRIDEWHKSQEGSSWDHADYVAFLREIDYLKKPGESFTIATNGVDA